MIPHEPSVHPARYSLHFTPTDVPESELPAVTAGFRRYG